MTAPVRPTALIIGASRGLGLALAVEYLKRDWRVIATRRAASAGLDEAAARHPGRLEIEQIDVADPATIAALRTRLEGRVIDLLFVNAGISNGATEIVGDISTERFIEMMLTNVLGPMRVIEQFASLVPEGGIIGAMSSGLGSVANNESGGWEVYRASKAALNTLMRSFAARTRSAGRSLVVIAPGWVRTDMGGPGASLGIEDSIPGVVDTSLAQPGLTQSGLAQSGLAQSGTPGLRYLDYQGKMVAW